MSDNEENIDDIRKDIEDTRQRISSEIDAIEGKLTPEYARATVRDTVKERAFETRDRVKERAMETRDRVAERVGETATLVRSNASRVGTDFGAAVRANPIPVAMIGLGAGWLVWETFRPLRASEELDVEPLVDLDVDIEVDETIDYATGVMGPIPSSMRTEVAPAETYGEVPSNGLKNAKERARVARERVGSRARDVKGRFSTASHDARERASHFSEDMRGRASHFSEDMRGRASHFSEDMRGRASELATRSRDRSRVMAERSRERAYRARDASNEAFDANPIAFGAIALLAGIGLGLALPHTRREDRLLGDRRQQVLGRARRIADEARHVAIDSVKEGAKVAKDRAKTEAEERNLIR
ncbi:apolipoprotein A1/A4/E family protein [Sandaracinus amylolyticus]|uniref:apolipoprotein A1/A4/E family protein n=1 Tax=Sandaracinus amylolyticus TaxID=927083 RepID=UPI001F2BEF0E|nr:apolipoprotein A1/A4/E family protein [Sandaracinus amylolyticus]UJR81018.1 Hypothetical protein I5071_30690 [Sandaracinus amylolyticus]